MPRPINAYGRTKVDAERVVVVGARAAIARLSLVVGLPAFGAGNSFLVRMLKAWGEGGHRAGSGRREIHTPIDVNTVGQALLELATRDLTGVFHLAGNTRVSRFEMAGQIATAFGYSVDRVAAQSPPVSSGRAPRPRDVSLSNAKARARLRTPMLDLSEALRLIRQPLLSPP